MFIIQPAVLEELKEIFSKVVFSRTNEITKITDSSAFNALAFGSSKLAQKGIKEVALAQSHFFPDTSYGQYLDNIALFYGIAPRFSAIGSSTYVRLVAEPGTTYTAGAHTFSGSKGIVFSLDETKVVGDSGFTYAKISSNSIGVETNVDAFDINTITPIPNGHQFVTNEFAAFGGRDLEDDDAFRERIKNANNELARGTIAMLEQVLMKINPKVLRIIHHGVNSSGQVRLSVVTQNGASLTNNEIQTLIDESKQYFTLTELNPNGILGVGVEYVNVDWQEVDISMRVRLNPNYNPAEVRKNMQVKMNRFLDYRFWEPGDKVEWDDLLEIAKRTAGIDYVLDSYFFPNNDVPVYYPNLPRLRGFLMLDESGAVLSDGTENFNPVFYPSQPDFSFWGTVLSNI